MGTVGCLRATQPKNVHRQIEVISDISTSCLQIPLVGIYLFFSFLQFAVQQQAGGAESAAIAEWMVGVTEQYFYDNGE